VANRFTALLAGLLFVTLAGCSDGPDLAPVSGSISLDGKPLPYGYVIFQPAKGQLSQGEIKAGKFTMSTRSPEDGATIGSHQVSVVCFEGHAPEKKAQQGPSMSLGRSLIPAPYTRSGSSGLTIEVPPEGKTDVVFELSSKGPGR
jgi:hypothetical protein